MPLRVWTDSSAAMGTVARQGLGKLRHLECHSLWVQQRLRRKEFELRKVDGTKNPADLFTKHMDSSAKLDGLVERFNCVFRSGRPEAAPQLKKIHCVDEERPGRRQRGRVCDPSACALVTDGSLPHLLPPEVMEREHPPARPEAETMGEIDRTPKEELSDPVPELQARRARQRAKDDECMTVENGTARASRDGERPAARAVGECLDVGHSEVRSSTSTSTTCSQEESLWEGSGCAAASPMVVGQERPHLHRRVHRRLPLRAGPRRTVDCVHGASDGRRRTTRIVSSGCLSTRARTYVAHQGRRALGFAIPSVCRSTREITRCMTRTDWSAAIQIRADPFCIC